MLTPPIRAIVLACGIAAAIVLLTTRSSADSADAFGLKIHLDELGAAFSDTMHGVFFEDINYAADGGLYAELVQNRSFEHPAPMHAWSSCGEATVSVIDEDGVHPNNPHFCRARVGGAGGVANQGFDGIAVREAATYQIALHVRGEPGASVQAILRDEQGQVVAEADLGQCVQRWRRLEADIVAAKSAEEATLEVRFSEAGAYDIDVVSLMPQETFRGHRNGLRKDLAQKIADLSPAFVRFPGGCIVEGWSLDNAYRWKDTVGPIWQRKQNANLWTNNRFPQYQQTYGLGFFEYFQFCEDIDAEPVPIVNCGMACQARRGPAAPMDELGPWVQDALDLVEFANGPVTSKWGKLRADMGHPEPFNMKYLGVGNEQWMEDYFERYLVFHKALRDRYPDLQIISTSGPQANDPFYRYAWGRFDDDVPADIVDEHYYRTPQWFLANSTRYDSYDPRGPKVFAGEFAAHEPGRASTLRAAVAEAAFMTGLWRNAEVVTMASYAPLFARAGSVQWAPDLIWFNNTESYGTPSYYVQAMYGQHVPDRVLDVSLDTSMLPPPVLSGRVGIGTWRTQAEFKNVRVIRGDKTLYESDGTLDGWETFGGDWSAESGVIRQTDESENVRAFVGDPSWSDYSVRLQARKLAGSEGFLVSFASTDPNQTSWWNLGGWGNTDHGLESAQIALRRVPGQIETGRWYDVRIDVEPSRFSCYLDGELVQQAELTASPAIFAAAGWDEETSEWVAAIANPGDTPCRGRIELAGGRSTATAAQALCLTSESASDENEFDAPERVYPLESTVPVTAGGTIEHTFPACSFTILRASADR